MRFLADENIHADLVAWLRSRGHDVAYAAEVLAGEPDEVLLQRARSEARILVTDDKDFGNLVVHRRLATAGVLLLRMRNPVPSHRTDRLLAVWSSIEAKMAGSFVVISDRRVRVRPLPPAEGEGTTQGAGAAG